MSIKTNPEMLVVVDMQPYFLAARDEKVVQACISLIKTFMCQNKPIFVLEYGRTGNEDREVCGPTDAEILKVINGYPFAFQVEKNINDGSLFISAVIKEKNLPAKKGTEFAVCGVNTTACVEETADGLVRMGFKVVIVQDACNDDWFGQSPKVWDIFYRKNRTKLIPNIPFFQNKFFSS